MHKYTKSNHTLWSQSNYNGLVPLPSTLWSHQQQLQPQHLSSPLLTQASEEPMFSIEQTNSIQQTHQHQQQKPIYVQSQNNVEYENWAIQNHFVVDSYTNNDIVLIKVSSKTNIFIGLILYYVYIMTTLQTF